jgi:predicted secreted protein
MRRRQFTPLMMLAVEANTVIALRMMKLMVGGRSARREAERMVTEKAHAAFEAGASLLAGASGNDIVHRYRQHVARNAKRLGKISKPRKRRRGRTS